MIFIFRLLEFSMNFKYKKKLIDSYRKVRRLNTDIYADTYRGWMYYNSYIPYRSDFLKEMRTKAIAKGIKDIDFYIHIPFCPTLCKYCDYYKQVINIKKADQYIEWLISYLDEYKEIFKNVVFRSLYIGGWTPSVLLPEQLERLLKYIFSNFKFSEIWEKTFEINPYTLNNQKWRIISKYPFNRISMGVQTLDKKVLKEVNRWYQNENILIETVRFIRSSSTIKYINADVIMGLKYEDNLEKFKYTILRLGEIWYNQVVLYRLLPTDDYLNEHYNWNLYLFYKEFFPKIKSYYKLIKRDLYTLKNFYKIINIDLHSGYRWDLLKEERDYIIYDDFWFHSLFAVWPSARWHIYGRFYYEFPRSLDFIWKDFRDTLILWKYIDLKDEISLYTIVNIMRYWNLDLEDFYIRFNIDFEKYFQNELEYLDKNWKILLKKNKKIYFYFKFYEKNYYALYFLDIKRLEELNLLNGVYLDTYKLIEKYGYKLFYDKFSKKVLIDNLFFSKKNIYEFYNIVDNIKWIIK